MVGSNLVDLVGDVLRNRKTLSAPTYSDVFLQLLVNLNVPEELIRNKSRLAQYRSRKGFNNTWHVKYSTQSNDDYSISNRKSDVVKQRREKSAIIRKSKLQKKTRKMYNWMSL